MTQRLLVALSAILCLGACHRSTGPPSTVYSEIRSGPELSQAFATAYGQAAPVTRPYQADDIDTTLTYSPQALIATANAYFLVAQARNNLDCHACSSGIAITTFAVSGGRPDKIIATLPLVEGGGGFAEPAQWRIDTRFTANPALLIAGSYSGACSDTGLQMVELTPDGAQVRSDFIQLTRDDEALNAAAPHFTGQMRPLVRGRSFAVIYAGSFVKRVTYSLENGRFLPDVDTSEAMC